MISKYEHADELVRRLLDHPREFFEAGSAYELLQEFFCGYPIANLRLLLRHDELYVRKSAIWIASELGAEACEVAADAMPLLESGDRYVRYHSMEFVIVCWEGIAERFWKVLRNIDSSDAMLREHAMFLISNTILLRSEDDDAFGEVVKFLHTTGKPRFADGLSLLLRASIANCSTVREMLNGEERLERSYAAMAARHLRGSCPELIHLAHDSHDESVREFADHVMDIDQRKTSS